MTLEDAIGITHADDPMHCSNSQLLAECGLSALASAYDSKYFQGAMELKPQNALPQLVRVKFYLPMFCLTSI